MAQRVAVWAVPVEWWARRQWVLSRAVEERGKVQKVPYQPSGRRASATDPATWVAFDAAVDAVLGGRADWPGLVLTADDPYCCLDLDEARDAATGALKPWAARIVEACGSYTEVSASGRGLHVFVRAALPGHRGRVRGHEGGKLEVYDHARVIALTGWRLGGVPRAVRPAQAVVDALLREWWPPAREGPVAQALRAAGWLPLASEDEAVLAAARRAANGGKFAALYDRGDLSGYTHGDGTPDPSAADSALCHLLAWWTDDAGQIDRLFRRSALYRPEKWDRRAGALTYGELTIAKALERVRAQRHAGRARGGPRPYL